MGVIKLHKCEIQVVRMGWERYFNQFQPDVYREPVFNAASGREDLFRQKRSTEALLRDALSVYWTDADDFEVAYDSNVALTMCGGIYSHRIVCAEYLEVLSGVMRTLGGPPCWAYDTSIELAEPICAMTTCSFVLRGLELTLLDHNLQQFEFETWFSRRMTYRN